MLVLIHSMAAIIALALGSVVLLQNKGTKLHKILGYIFVGCMFLSAFSSFGIYTYADKLSVIHILSLMVIIWLCVAMYAIRFKPKNWLHIHASSIGSAYISLIIAGVGVFVRKIVLPGNFNAGYWASAFTTIVCIYLLRKMTLKYKHSSRNEG